MCVRVCEIERERELIIFLDQQEAPKFQPIKTILGMRRGGGKHKIVLQGHLFLSGLENVLN